MSLRLADAFHAQRKCDVIDHRQMRKKCVVLEHHGRAAVGRRGVSDLLVGNHDGAFAYVLVPGDHPQRGSFAATRGSQQTAIGAGLDLQRNPIDGDAGAIALDDGGSSRSAARLIFAFPVSPATGGKQHAKAGACFSGAAKRVVTRHRGHAAQIKVRQETQFAGHLPSVRRGNR